MSGSLKSTGDSSFPDRKRRPAVARRRASSRLFGVPRSEGTQAWAIVESLEIRRLLTAPAINLGAGVLASYTEDTAAQPVAPNASLTNPPAALGAGDLTVVVATNNTSSDQLSIGQTNGITLNDVVIAGATVHQVSYQNTPIGSIATNGNVVQDGTGTVPLEVSLLAGDSLNAINALLSSVSYNNTSHNAVANVAITFSLDGIAAPATIPPATTPSIALIHVNDAPVLAPGAPVLPRVVMNPATNAGVSVATLIAGLITDPDANALQGIAVTLASATNGAWQYSTNAGATWTNFNTTNSTTSDANARLLSDAPSNQIRFVPTADGSATFSFRAWDRTTGTDGGTADLSTPSSHGGSTAFSDNVDTASILVNDAPVLAAASPMLASVDVNQPAATITGTLVSVLIAGLVTDSNPQAMQGIAVTGVDDTHGDWQFSTNSGTSWTDFTTSTTNTNARLLAASPADKVRFVPGTDYVGTATFTFRAWDQTTGADGGTADTSSHGGSTAFSDQVDTATVTVANKADVGVTYVDSTGQPITTGSLAPVLAGEDLTYRVQVSDNGPGAAAGVTLLDALPTGVTFASVSLNGSPLNILPTNNTLTVPIGNLAKNSAETVTIVVRPTTLAAASISNTVSLAPQAYDANPANDTASINTVVAQLRFDQSSYTIHQDVAANKTLNASVVLSADLGRTVMVTVSDTPGTAVRGVDYQGFTQTILVGPTAGSYPIVNGMGQSPIVILPSQTINGPLNFGLTMSYPQSTAAGAVPVVPVATVQIIPDATSVVSNLNATGAGSLYEAIRAVNGSTGFHPITFDSNAIVDPVPTIIVTTELPIIIHPVSIDGRLSGGRAIHIMGSGGIGPGLEFNYVRAVPNVPNGSTLQGVVIEGFNGGLVLAGQGDHRIVGDQFLGDTAFGIQIDGSSNNTIGGVAGGDGNTIAATTQAGVAAIGIELKAEPSLIPSNNLIDGNQIGLDAGGAPAGNLLGGIVIDDGVNNTIGGVSSDGLRSQGGNVIADNGEGVKVIQGSGNAIRGNAIFGNTGPGIDLQPAVNPIEAAPVLEGATFANGIASLQGVLPVAQGTSKTYHIDFYANSVPNPGVLPAGFPAAGATFVGSYDLVVQNFNDPSGTASFSTTFQTLNVQLGQFVTATATDPDGNTSVFSNFQQVTPPTVVRNNLDSGPNSLRAALDFSELAVRDNPNQAVTITFDITNPKYLTNSLAIIHLLSPLTATKPVDIDGNRANAVNTLVNGDNANLYVVLDGGGAIADGLTLEGGGAIRGLVFQNFTHSAVNLQGGVGYQVEGNFIGVGASGAGVGVAGAPNITGDAIDVNGASNVVIGGATPDTRNLIAGASQSGIHVSEPLGGTVNGVTIQNNYIGTNRDGTALVGNGGDGIFVDQVSGVTVIGNRIAGNTGYGIDVSGGASDSITNNQVGVPSVGNHSGGILLSGATDVTIGGRSSAQNVIASNSGNGIAVMNGSGHRIAGNIIGSDTNQTSILANTGDGVFLSNASNVVVGAYVDGNGLALGDGNTIVNNQSNGIEVSGAQSSQVVLVGNAIGTDASGTLKTFGNTGDAVSIHDVQPGSPDLGVIVANNVIAGQVGGTGNGVKVSNASDTRITGNFIGENRAGAALQVGGDGVILASAPNTTIGANTIGESNKNGVEVTTAGSTGARIMGNMIGVDPIGAKARPNTLDGIKIDAASGTAVSGNVVSANQGSGIEVLDQAGGSTIQGNKIGTDLSGTIALANGMAGVVVSGASNTTIGGASAGASNIISGNVADGVLIESGSVGTVVQANRIGTDAFGASPLGNRVGIEVNGVAGAAILGNVVSANSGGDGLLIDNGASGVSVTGNTIGLNAAGNGPLPNSGAGIDLNSAHDNTIGGPGATDGNLISGNAGDGVLIEGTSPNNLVQGDSIGTDATGTVAVKNLIGVEIKDVTGGARLLGNLISGNGSGVVIDGATTGASLVGNHIGTDRAIGTSIANGIGVVIAGTASGNTLSVNVIAGNAHDGLLVSAGTADTSIQSNLIGTNAAGASILGNGGNGVELAGTANVTIQGNTIAANNLDGLLASNASGLMIVRDVIGGNSAAGAPGNHGDGVHLVGPTGVTIGGGASDANTIGRNGVNGVEIDGLSRNVTLVANFIGVDSLGNLLANVGDGILVADGGSPAGSVAITSNTVAGNERNGIELAGASGVVVSGRNYLGTSAGDVKGLIGNQLDGVLFTAGAQGNTVTGYNLIAQNGGQGVEFTGETTKGNTLDHDFVELNGADGIRLAKSATNNTISGNAIGTDGSSLSQGNFSNGIEISGAVGNTIDHNAIADNRNSGVLIFNGASANVLTANFIGNPNPGSKNGLGNSNDGVTILAAGPGNTLDSNTIVGNNSNGVLISQSSGTVLRRNLIGTDASGASGDGNASAGVNIAASNNVVVDHNTIASNMSHGILVSDAQTTIISGNLIGVGPDGRPGNNLGNILTGISVIGGSGNQIIGANVIGANDSHGVILFQSSGDTISGNVIGTDLSRTLAIGNKGDGIFIVDSSSNSVSGNTISDNTLSAVEILGQQAGTTETSSNVVAGNVLGSLINAKLGNQLNGVLISGSRAGGNVVQSNSITANQANGISVVSSPGNTIAANVLGVTSLDSADRSFGNALDGVKLTTSAGTTIQSNLIEQNGVDGIDLLGSTGSTLSSNRVRDNGGDGIRLEENSNDNTIGGGSLGPNVVVHQVPRLNPGLPIAPGSASTGSGGNTTGSAGIDILTGSTRNSIANDWIGFDGSGGTGGNSIGVLLDTVSGNTIGGVARDTISGNVIGVEINGGGANLVQGNLVGTDFSGTLAVPNDVGVFLNNSASNRLVSNLVSGNYTAGVELSGTQATGNTLTGNIIGSNFTQTNAIVFPGAVPQGVPVQNVYVDPTQGSAPSRQTDGVRILGGSSGNLIGLYGAGNVIAGNYNGVHLIGADSSTNYVVGNQIGHGIGDPKTQPNDPTLPTAGLANFFGVFVDGAAGNTIALNQIDGNVSIGVALIGSLTNGTRVQTNEISRNGAYGATTTNPNDPNSPALPAGAIQLADGSQGFHRVYGSGVYVETAPGNVIGSIAVAPGKGVPPENPAYGNAINNNTLVGVYLFNNATGNISVRSNVIEGGYYAGGNALGEYGVFLFNSSADLFQVQMQGAFKNSINDSRIANFREFTGPTPTGPITVSQITPRPPKVKVAARAALKAFSVPSFGRPKG